MPRSPADATRFTATGPYISTKPSSSSPSFAQNQPSASGPTTSSSQLQFGGPAPPNETPQQKIARLRAAADAARAGKESTFDATVRVGRVWADRAHRFTTISLIGLTVVSGAVATAGITDMLLHNRKRRNEWLAEQQRKSVVELAEARQAIAQGVASEDQMLLINRNRAAQEAAEAKRNRPGIFKRAKSWLFSGLSEEEQKGGKLGSAATTTAATMQEAKGGLLGKNEDRSVLQAVEDKVNSHRRQAERLEEAILPSGGPLDRQAQLMIDSASDTGRSWKSWITGR